MDSSKALCVRFGPEEEDNGGGGETRKKKKELSEDDIVEIFARLPVKSLIRFRCVSKLWYNLILSPNFITMHSAHSKTVTLWCRLSVSGANNSGQVHRKATISLRLGEHLVEEEDVPFYGQLEMIGKVSIVGCFNGVVCLSISGCQQRYALWNPATTQVREIGGAPMDGAPSGSTTTFYATGNWCGSGFCFDQLTSSFMIAQMKFTVIEESRETRAQVNKFSTASNSWTEKNMVVPYRIWGSGLSIIGSATCVNGYMHWHVTTFHPDGLGSNNMYILSYDMIDDVFQRTEIPSRPVRSTIRLAGYKGSLAIFVCWRTSSLEVDMWVMDNSGGSNQSCTKILTLKPSIEVTRVVGFFRKDGVDLILMSSKLNDSLYVYDPVNSKTKKLSIARPMSGTFLYRESFVSLN